MAAPTAPTTIEATPSWLGGTSYRLPARAEPSWWGEDTSFGIMAGALVGMVMPTVLGLFFPGADAFFNSNGAGAWMARLAPVLAGGAVGAVANKARMERELTEGKEISPPSFFNRGLIEGAVHGIALVKMVAWGASYLLPNILTVGASVSAFTGFGLAALGIAAGIGAIRAALQRQDEQEQIYNFVENSYALQNGLPLREKGKGIGQYLGPAAGVATAVAAGLPGDPIGAGMAVFGDAAGASTAFAENTAQLAAAQRHYPDFSDVEGHPAHRREGFSFVQAEEARRRSGQTITAPQAENAAPNYGRFADRLSDQRMADAVSALQNNRT